MVVRRTNVCAKRGQANSTKDEENFMWRLGRASRVMPAGAGRNPGFSVTSTETDNEANIFRHSPRDVISAPHSRSAQYTDAIASTQQSTLTRAPPLSLSSMRKQYPCNRTIAETMLRPSP